MTSPVSPLSPVLKRSREERQRDSESNNANRATLGNFEWEGRVRKVGDRCKFRLSTEFAFRSLGLWARCAGDISPQFEVLWLTLVALEPLLPSVLLRDRKWRRRRRSRRPRKEGSRGETCALEQFSGKCIHQRLRTL